jgi:hypothetical protein
LFPPRSRSETFSHVWVLDLHHNFLADTKQFYTMAVAAPVIINTASWRNIRATISYDYDNVDDCGSTFRAPSSYDMFMETLKVHGTEALKKKCNNLGRNPWSEILSVTYGGGDEDNENAVEESILNEANYAAYLDHTALPRLSVSYVYNILRTIFFFPIPVVRRRKTVFCFEGPKSMCAPRPSVPTRQTRCTRTPMDTTQ